jgi:hypothetical protein
MRILVRRRPRPAPPPEPQHHPGRPRRPRRRLAHGRPAARARPHPPARHRSAVGAGRHGGVTPWERAATGSPWPWSTTAGITMSPCRLLEEGGRAHFMTRRFDRDDDGGKVHMLSLCALAHLDFNRPGAHGYAQLFAVMRKLNLGQPALQQQYRRTVFNVLAYNRDDHTRRPARPRRAHGARRRPGDHRRGRSSHRAMAWVRGRGRGAAGAGGAHRRGDRAMNRADRRNIWSFTVIRYSGHERCEETLASTDRHRLRHPAQALVDACRSSNAGSSTCASARFARPARSPRFCTYGTSARSTPSPNAPCGRSASSSVWAACWPGGFFSSGPGNSRARSV